MSKEEKAREVAEKKGLAGAYLTLINYVPDEIIDSFYNNEIKKADQTLF